MTCSQIARSFGDTPVYLSWDMDVFDPSCAPGVCTPAWGGFSAREGLSFLRAMSGLNIVAADVNTVSPPHDINGMTAFLAAAVVHEIILLVHRARQETSRRGPVVSERAKPASPSPVATIASGGDRRTRSTDAQDGA
jgi:hypothetical protein